MQVDFSQNKNRNSFNESLLLKKKDMLKAKN